MLIRKHGKAVIVSQDIFFAFKSKTNLCTKNCMYQMRLFKSEVTRTFYFFCDYQCYTGPIKFKEVYLFYLENHWFQTTVNFLLQL